MYSTIDDVDDAWSQLVSLKVFKPATTKSTLDLIDIRTASPQFVRTTKTFSYADEFEQYLKQSSVEGGTRFISIFQKNSWAGLEISRSMLEALIRTHEMIPEILEVVRCFQDKTCNVEEAYSGASWHRTTSNKREMAFVVKYPENNARTDGADPWSIRQTGVYQSFDVTTKTSVWILINPRHNTTAEKRLKDLLSSEEKLSTMEGQLPLVGLMALSTYFGNWRTYMAFYEKEELRMSGKVISTIIEEELNLNHSMLLQLRRLEARLLLLPPIFQSLTQIIQTFQTMNDAFLADGAVSFDVHKATQENLQNYSRAAAAYQQNATFILQKIRATAQVLSDTLKMKHQQMVENISKNTLGLNNKVVQDSATIRVITVVTLLFLPGQFIATLFGMQFFSTDSMGSLTVSSSSLWMFFAIAVPFTAATFAYWKWTDRKQKLKAGLYEMGIKC